LDYFEPSGHGNPAPLFLWRGAQVSDKRVVGKEGAHLKLKVRAGDGVQLDVIGFWLGDRLGELPMKVDLVFAFEKNEWKGRYRQQINLKDVRAAG
jgi:single-stranded-DNA-specific exonuclease